MAARLAAEVRPYLEAAVRPGVSEVRETTLMIC